jgi:anti-sigma factor RsiW
MNSIEETLWNYIDGTCTPAERQAISKLIAEDEEYRLVYNELLQLNQQFAAIELDEPPMAFTYNVMEGIRTEQAQVPLKAAFNKRIVWSIVLFFITTLTAALVFTLSNINLSAAGTAVVSTPVNFRVPDITKYISKPVIEGFVFFDIVLGLYFLDGYLRKKKVARQA